MWDDQTAPVPFKDVDVEVLDKTNLQRALDLKTVTKEEMCNALPADVGAPCS
jgi:hypothetical protein